MGNWRCSARPSMMATNWAASSRCWGARLKALNRKISSNWSTSSSRLALLFSRWGARCSRRPASPRSGMAAARGLSAALSAIWPVATRIASARCRRGASPGFILATSQASRSSTRKPPSSFGISPARISDDLPQPELPTTARKRVLCSCRSSSRVCSWRPKNSSVSSVSKGRSPTKGFSGSGQLTPHLPTGCQGPGRGGWGSGRLDCCRWS